MGKPVLLSVDDDPGVSRAVARDLRRKYGEDYRVLRASSGPEALDALRELKLRGDTVVALLADYRMPDMNGIEFLEKAMDLFPRARRALLTAYADTDAAIQAINVVDVDAYRASEGLRTVLVEREATGGQAGQSSRIENYLGFPNGVSGGQLADRARRQARQFGAELLLTRDCVALEAHGSQRVLRFDDGSTIGAHAVVLATGVSYRSLGVPGADGLTGRGVYYGSAMTEAAACADRKGVIVGGANSAGQAAVFFARYASSVHLLVRGPSLEASMSHYLIEQLAAIENVHVHTCTTVAEAHGTDHLEQVTLLDAKTGERSTYEASHLFVFIGGEPRTSWLDGVLVRDDRGFIPTRP